MKSNPKLIHDFINQSLRIEIIQKLICEKLQEKAPPQKEHIKDLSTALKKQIELLQELELDS